MLTQCRCLLLLLSQSAGAASELLLVPLVIDLIGVASSLHLSGASSLLAAPAASLKGVPVDTSTLAFHSPPTHTHTHAQTQLAANPPAN